jgi:drug/metabolite transporter (DMT)-like permease
MRAALAFAIINIVWGSTYLAIRYAVADVPPLMTAAIRHLVAGAALYAWTRYSGRRASWTEWRHSVVVGALFFLVGHGTLHWAEQLVPSGLAAVLVATEPIWIAVFLSISGHATMTARGIVGLILGLSGVALLAGRDMLSASPALMMGGLSILIGAASWGAGIIYAQRAEVPRDPLVRTATTLLAGAGLLVVASASFGEFGRVKAPSFAAIAALAYLAVFGSIIAFTAYYWLLDRYPATLVATHTYVNPVVAVLLGWAFAGEPITPRLMIAMLAIVGAIALVSVDAKRPEPAGPDSKRPAVGRAPSGPPGPIRKVRG